jgi:hypothetical protein
VGIVSQTVDERRTNLGPAAVPEPSAGGLRLALRIGALVWLALLLVGFFAPGGWVWGMAGPIGHIENYMISLWFVGLVAAPLLASVDPLGRSSAVQVYLLAILAIVASTARGEPLKLIADAPPLAVSAACLGAVIICHPRRVQLLRR